MKYYAETKYPDEVDSLLYYSDASYDNKDTIDEYKKEWQNGNIDEAIELIQNDEKLHYSSADLLNRLEFQLKTIQEYLLTKENIVNPMVHKDEEPLDPETYYIWASSIE